MTEQGEDSLGLQGRENPCDFLTEVALGLCSLVERAQVRQESQADMEEPHPGSPAVCLAVGRTLPGTSCQCCLLEVAG